jgi:hypothetical protein
MKRTLLLLMLTAACQGQATRPAPGELRADRPIVDAPQPGEIVGRVRPAGRIASVHAVNRDTRKKVSPRSFDRETGRFVIAPVASEAHWDVVIKTRDGRRFEGIDLSFVGDRYRRLAALRREQLGVESEPERLFTPADAEALLAYVRDAQDFMEQRRVLYVKGHGRRATMLVELMRTRDFYARRGGEVIWRIELWYFENQFGGWQREPNVEKVLRRERIPPGQWRKIHVEYEPRLSVFVNREGESRPIDFALPEKPDASRGRPANTSPELETDPHILGVTQRAATQSDG